MLILVTSLYAALLALVYFVLFGMVGRVRGQLKISLGDGGNPELIVANRRHMNFVENVPLALLLILLVEMNGATTTYVHALGAVLLASRIIHPFGLKPDNMGSMPRVIGAGGTALVILASVVTLLWQFAKG